MNRAVISSAAALCAAAWCAAPVQAEGPLGTAHQGYYVCELPGSAAGPRGIEQEGASFRVEGASRYSSTTGSGTYLRRGDQLVFTSGARNGERYQIVSDSFLRKLDDDGKPSRLRCVRRGR